MKINKGIGRPSIVFPVIDDEEVVTAEALGAVDGGANGGAQSDS